MEKGARRTWRGKAEMLLSRIPRIHTKIGGIRGQVFSVAKRTPCQGPLATGDCLSSLLFPLSISMIYVFDNFRQARLWRDQYHEREKDVPTQQQQAEKNARLQRADVEQRRPAGA